jgi:hypothetical protein
VDAAGFASFSAFSGLKTMSQLSTGVVAERSLTFATL